VSPHLCVTAPIVAPDFKEMPMRRLLLAPLFAVAVVVASAAPALAQVAPDGNASPDAPVSSVLTVSNTLVMFITGALVPILNGFLLRPSNPGWVKVLLSQIVVTAVHAFSQVIQDDGTAALSQEWFVQLAFTSLVMVATYMGFWKPVSDPNATLPTVLPDHDPAHAFEMDG